MFKGKAWTVSMSFKAAGLDEKVKGVNADREEKRSELWAMPINKGKWKATRGIWRTRKVCLESVKEGEIN